MREFSFFFLIKIKTSYFFINCIARPQAFYFYFLIKSCIIFSITFSAFAYNIFNKIWRASRIVLRDCLYSTYRSSRGWTLRPRTVCLPNTSYPLHARQVILKNSYISVSQQDYFKVNEYLFFIFVHHYSILVNCYLKNDTFGINPFMNCSCKLSLEYSALRDVVL